jgi:hypothetical protein
MKTMNKIKPVSIYHVGMFLGALAKRLGYAQWAGCVYNKTGTLLDSRNDRQSLLLAVAAYEAARDCFTPNSANLALALANQACAREALADFEQEPVVHLEAALAGFEAAWDCFPAPREELAYTLGHQALVQMRLATEFGRDPVANLEAAVAGFKTARNHFDPGSDDFGQMLGQEACAREILADFGREPVANLEAAIAGWVAAQACYGAGSRDFGDLLVCQARARTTLAQIGEAPVANLQAAVQKYDEALCCFTAGSPYLGSLLVSQAVVRTRLADIGQAPVATLQAALAGFEAAQKCFATGGHNWGVHQFNLAKVLQALAKAEPTSRLACLQRAYGALELGLTTLEQERCQLRPNQDRTPLLEEMTGQYALMVDVCLDLAEVHQHEGQNEPAEAWLWQAWHRVHEGKRWPFLELSRGERLRLFFDLRSLLDEPKPVTKQSAGTDPFFTAELPSPKKVRDKLFRLVQKTPRTLFVDLFTLSERDIAVFLLPLWENVPPRVLRYKVPGPSVRDLVAKLEGGGTSAEGTEATHQGSDKVPEEMGALVAPWMELVKQQRWEPTLMVISPHYLMNLLPWHAARWQGKALNEQVPVVYCPSASAGMFFNVSKFEGVIQKEEQCQN